MLAASRVDGPRSRAQGPPAVPRFDKLLILDLDETLLHAADSEDAVGRPADHRLFDYPLYRRPHVDAFLAWARERASMVRSPDGDAHVTSGRST